ncbi:MAG TPA: POTRA domain-containing protein [Pyrinomonadaceae bacterium]|nr:POTRA domain-containing protein [Pyrinomonadaceae bacterium]
MHRSIRNRGRLLVLSAAGIAMLFASAAINAQERTTLRKVEIHGLQRRSPDQVLATSGLKVGEPIDASMIDAAAARLMRSGWFQSVDYRVRTADSDTTVVFEVMEKIAPVNVAATETVGQVVWQGNAALSSEELSTAFGLRAGDPAPQAKIDEGLSRVRSAYARRGYINAQVIDVTRNLEGRRTSYQFTIREGRQYRMGLLSITGLAPADTRQLTNKWTLAPNAIFDDSYLEQFRTTVLRQFVASRTQRTGIRSKFEANTTPNSQKQTVDVIITFK